MNDEAFGDILSAIGKGELTPEEGDRIAAIVDKRVGLFATVELQGEIEALKSQLTALAAIRPAPMLRLAEWRHRSVPIARSHSAPIPTASQGAIIWSAARLTSSIT